MFECQICGLLSLGGTACPACGSQLRTDLAVDMEGGETLPSEVPGLDDAAEAWYDLEGIKPPTEETGDEPVSAQQESDSGGLPFGFQGESKVFAPRLPFGIGSSAEGIPFDAGNGTSPVSVGSTDHAVAPPPVSDVPSSPAPIASPPPEGKPTEPVAASEPLESQPLETPFNEPVAAVDAQPISQPPVSESPAPSLDHPPTPAPALEATPTTPSSVQSEVAPIVPATPTPSTSVTPIDSEATMVAAPVATDSGHSTEPVRLQTARLVQPSPVASPVETMAVSEAPAQSGAEGFPD